MNKFVEGSSFDRIEWENLIDRWVFGETDRKILKRKILDNVPIERIAEEIDYSVSQTKRRLAKAFNNLMKKI